MKHPLRWILGGAALVVVAAAAFGAWYVFGDDAPAKPTLAPDPPVASGGPATPVGRWTVAPGPKVYVGYRMTEVFRGDIVHTSAVGRTPTVTGKMTVATTAVTAADVRADLRNLESNRAARDNYIHTHGIESDDFPTSRFVLTKPIPLPAGLQKGTAVKASATGNLTLHGVTREVTVPVDARWDGPTIEVVGTAPIVLKDYKIDPPATSVVKTDDHGSLELSLTFVPS